MGIVSFIASVLYVAVTIYFVFMLARLVLDLARTFARQWRPRGAGLVLAEVVFAVTDPPIKLIRRVLPPLRLGGVALDFSWSLVMILVLIALSIIPAFMR